MFYLCTMEACNRKYKKAAAWLRHMQQQHQQIDNVVLPQPICVQHTQPVRDNTRLHYEQQARLQKEAAKKAAEMLREQMLEHEQNKIRLQLDKESERLLQEQQELQNQKTRRDCEMQIAKEYAGELRKLNGEKLRLENESVTLQQKRLDHVREHPEDCCICMDRPSTAAVVPCGHAYFCMPCLVEAKTNHSQRGCPFCRGKLENIITIYR